MAGTVLLGSSARMLQYMSWYPDSYYSFLRVAVASDGVVVADWRQLGGLHAGFNGFKFDFARNTMAVYRLSERLARHGSGYAHDWFAQEAAIADWFVAHGQSSSRRALWRSCGTSGVPTTRTFLTPRNLCVLRRCCARWRSARGSGRCGVAPCSAFWRTWRSRSPMTRRRGSKKQMTVREVVGEALTGFRVPFAFNRDVGKHVTGAEWVLVPLLTRSSATSGQTTPADSRMSCCARWTHRSSSSSRSSRETSCCATPTTAATAARRSA
ncbi:hypothetical protein PINS_up021019 [Pythium insidiosum]|nr:hypothetical protein PINS_up021019 [Pythium insidiosum]